MIKMSITAEDDGTSEWDGMRLAEVERTCAAFRRNGATDDTVLDVRTNRVHRIRTIGAEIDDPEPAPKDDPDGQGTDQTPPTTDAPPAS